MMREGTLGQFLPARSFHIPRRLEPSHVLLMGDTGSGKSSAIRQLLRQVADRGESAIVYDPAMDFLGEFYDPKRGDLILNPLDQRCPYWGLGDEIDRPETATTIAAAMLPDKDYEKAFFTDAPRRVLAHLLRRKPQPRDILRMMADPQSIEAAVRGTPLAALLDPGAPAQRAGVLSSLNMVADSLELLPEWEHTRNTFATAEWYTERKRWIFLTSSAAYRQKVLPLHSAWLDLFILRMMGYCEDQAAKPVWFVIDELASLNKLPQLHTAVTENRKYGNPVVMGLQGRSQMEKRYGQDAEAMLSQPATKIFLKTSEPRAAKWISEAIGEIEVERLKESRSMGLFTSKNSFSMEIATKPLIMASEIAGLAPLSGFIKLENHVVAAKFRLAKKKGKHPEFIERKLPEIAPRPSLPTPVVRTEQPKSSAAVQTTLPLFDAPADKPTDKPNEAFVWDESKGIE
jgi:type IV secretory pathway TraG/TraD family ATPase VirD4